MKLTKYTHAIKNITQWQTHQQYYLKMNISYYKK
jgi:hypothetical protein